MRNHNYFFIFLISLCLLLLLYIEPPITSAIVLSEGHDGEPSDVYAYFCLGCNLDYLFIPVYTLQILFALFGFIFTFWILQANFRKFARDGAQLAEEEDGTNSIMPDDDVVV